METTRSFGLINLPRIHTVPLCLKTNLSFSPRHLFQNHTLFRKPTKQNLLRAKASSDDLESTRPLIQFSPSFWGDHFLNVPFDDSEIDALDREIESKMKPLVRDMLMSIHSSDTEKIRLIHLLVNLGISFHIENEIDEILNMAFEKLDGLISESEDDLETISIMFEVFRLRGHYMSCDVFERFRGDDGELKVSLAGDVRGMLQLYEAAHLRTTAEDIMEDALSFTRSHLESWAVQEESSNPNLSRHIRNSLYRARYQNMEILAIRNYISFYDQEEEHDETLLKFAKLNFNFCQLHYIQELRHLTKWWKDLDLPSKLPYMRDRLVETYISALITFFEPKYSRGRIIFTKLLIVGVGMDDTCDAFGTLPEVESFIGSLQRWELGATNEVPSHIRIAVESMLETVEEIEKEMKPRGRLASVKLMVEEVKTLGRGYLDLARWARVGHVPTFEEYMEVAHVTSGMCVLLAYSIIAMEDCDEKQTNEWFESRPKIFEPLHAVFRLKNDIATYELEISRGEVANGVNCYMKQHGVGKQVAMEELNKMYNHNYKMIMEEFLTIKNVPRPVLVRCINITRPMEVFYKEGTDEYTNPQPKIKQFIASVLLHPFQL